MTLAIDKTTQLGALLTAVKAYSGNSESKGVRALAADMDIPESTLYAKLRGEKGYPLGVGGELDEILDFLQGKETPGWDRMIHVFCHRHDHLAIPIPHALRASSSDGLKQVSQMMNEVAEIAKALSDGVDASGEAGEEITSKELKRIEATCGEAMEKIAETLEYYRARHAAAKKKGLVR